MSCKEHKQDKTKKIKKRQTTIKMAKARNKRNEIIKVKKWCMATTSRTKKKQIEKKKTKKKKNWVDKNF